ncbi:hypothetical protein IWZ01DRAFT_570091, partial [Phyllosticta capitalensis]
VPTWEDLVDSESTGPEADQHLDKGPAQPPWHRNGRGTAASLLQSLQRRRRIAKRLLLLLSPPLLLETLRFDTRTQRTRTKASPTPSQRLGKSPSLLTTTPTPCPPKRQQPPSRHARRALSPLHRRRRRRRTKPRNRSTTSALLSANTPLKKYKPCRRLVATSSSTHSFEASTEVVSRGSLARALEVRRMCQHHNSDRLRRGSSIRELW